MEIEKKAFAIRATEIRRIEISLQAIQKESGFPLTLTPNILYFQKSTISQKHIY